MKKNLTAEILVHPQDVKRFLNGCTHYGLKAKRKGRSDYYTVTYEEASDLYWLGANMYGHQYPNQSTLTKPVF